jgi:hypothetical protein
MTEDPNFGGYETIAILLSASVSDAMRSSGYNRKLPASRGLSRI